MKRNAKMKEKEIILTINGISFVVNRTFLTFDKNIPNLKRKSSLGNRKSKKHKGGSLRRRSRKRTISRKRYYY